MTAPDFSPKPEARLNQTTPKGAQLKKDLERVFNANCIDVEMGMPDFTLASLTMNLLESVRMSNATTESWKSS